MSQSSKKREPRRARSLCLIHALAAGEHGLGVAGLGNSPLRSSGSQHGISVLVDLRPIANPELDVGQALREVLDVFFRGVVTREEVEVHLDAAGGLHAGDVDEDERFSALGLDDLGSEGDVTHIARCEVEAGNVIDIGLLSEIDVLFHIDLELKVNYQVPGGSPIA